MPIGSYLDRPGTSGTIQWTLDKPSADRVRLPSITPADALAQGVDKMSLTSRKSDSPRAWHAVQKHRIFPIGRWTSFALWAAMALGCSRDRVAPQPSPPASSPRSSVVEGAREIEASGPYRASVGRAELYLPPWFSPKHGGYDLIVHFHGERRWQEANVTHAHLNVAVLSINLGAGTDPYANAFRTPESFERLLADTEAEIARSGRADGAERRRLALSAWSAGFSSIARVMTDALAERVDAILLADGFFTFFSDPKKRTVNAAGLQKFARFADAARRGEKLFALTHTTIPTGPYPSVQECTAKLLELLDEPKVPTNAVGPRAMHAIYTVDRGSLHIHGFEGTTAADHVKQLHAMGETVYPYLKARWEGADATTARPSDHGRPHAAP
jgi:hypothetical protein